MKNKFDENMRKTDNAIAASSKQQAASSKQQAASSKQQAASSKQQAKLTSPKNTKQTESVPTPGRALIKSKKRVKEFGEVFTPDHIVKQMCDYCEPYISALDKKVFEPTCGNGNFLVEILKRKLGKIPTSVKNSKTHSRKNGVSKLEFYILLALSNIYAVDIQQDNVEESRERMRSIIFDFVKNIKTSIYFLNAVDEILRVNIILGDSLKRKKDIIFFDFQPDNDERTFEITKYSLLDIEKIAENSTFSSVEDIKDKLHSLKYPPPTAKPKAKPKKKKTTKQAQLF